MASLTSPPRILVVFDVDSTLIEQEVIELLADSAGKGAEVAEVTNRAMSGELDFTQSLKARVQTLQGLPESVIAEALAKITISQGAIELIATVQKNGGKVAAVSGGFVQLLKPLATMLGLDAHRANTLEVIDGVLTGNVIGEIIDKPAKARALQEWSTHFEIEMRNTVAIGDGANDLDMMDAAGLSLGFNAKPRVRASADVIIGTKNLGEAIALLGF